MITFKEHHELGYKARTIENAKANITIAIANDFTTAGERLTKNAVLKHGKLYVPIKYEDIKNRTFVQASAISVIHIAGKYSTEVINIAGNGIYSLFETQQEVDQHVYNFLKAVLNSFVSRYIPLPRLIISGGQTGIDEAGLKAADKLNIPALCLAPNGWLFRNANGVDIANEKLFKSRFEQ